MSATAEKPRAGRRSRVEILEAAIEERRQKVAAALREIADLASDEDQAAAESLRADPSKSAFALRSPAHELRRKRGEAEKSVANLEKEILLLEGELGAARAAEAASALSERTQAAKKLAQRERELRREAGEALAAVVTKWNALAECLGQRSEQAAEVNREQLIERAELVDRDGQHRWEEAAAFTVEPVPTTLAAFLDEALEATTGERPSDDDGGSLVELNRQRAALGLVPEVRHVSPAARELADCYPDLCGEVRTAEVAGVAIRRRESAALGWGGEAA